MSPQRDGEHSAGTAPAVDNLVFIGVLDSACVLAYLPLRLGEFGQNSRVISPLHLPDVPIQ